MGGVCKQAARRLTRPSSGVVRVGVVTGQEAFGTLRTMPYERQTFWPVTEP